VSKNNINFSIIIAAYNRKDYIYKAFLSAFNQNYPRDNYEIIVVSNFINKEITESATTNPDFIKIILIDKIGYGDKLKEGINIARGEYICFLDDDDLFTEDKLLVLNDIILKENNIGIIKNYCNLIDSMGNTMEFKSNMGIIIGLAEPLNYYNIKYKNKDGYFIIAKYQNKYSDFIGAFSNMSSLTILKSIIEKYLNKLSCFFIALESFLLTVAVNENKKCVITSSTLTAFRIHNNNTTSINIGITKQINFLLNESNDFRISAIIANNIGYKTSLKVISARLYIASIYKYYQLNGFLKTLKFLKMGRLILDMGYAVFGQPELRIFKMPMTAFMKLVKSKSPKIN